MFTAEITLIAFLYLFQDKWHYIQKQGVILGNEPVSPTDQEIAPRDRPKEIRWLILVENRVNYFNWYWILWNLFTISFRVWFERWVLKVVFGSRICSDIFMEAREKVIGKMRKGWTSSGPKNKIKSTIQTQPLRHGTLMAVHKIHRSSKYVSIGKQWWDCKACLDIICNVYILERKT